MGLIIYIIGAILAFGLLYALAIDLNDKEEVWMVIVGTILSWVTVGFIVYRLYSDARKDRRNPLP